MKFNHTNPLKPIISTMHSSILKSQRIEIQTYKMLMFNL